MRYFLLLPFLVACGHGLPSQQIDPELAAYAERFKEAALVYGKTLDVSVPMVFSPTVQGGELVGDCHHGVGRWVEISRAEWEKATDDQREELVFHELGHCILQRVHRGDSTNNGTTCSIMNPHPERMDYAAHREGYLRELFLEGECAVPMNL